MSIRTNQTRLILTVLTALGFFWALFHLSLYGSSDGRQYFTNTFDVAPAAYPKPTRPDTYEANEGWYGWDTCPGPCYFAARFRFAPSDLTADWAIAPSYNTDNFAIYLNGVAVEAKGNLAPAPSYHGKRTWLTRLPAALFKPGENHVEIVLARATQPAALRGAFIGPYTGMAEALRYRFFAFYELPAILVVIGLTLGGLVLILTPLMTQRSQAVWFAVVSISWALLTHYRLWFEFPFGPEVRAGYYFALLNAVYLGLFNFFDVWSGQDNTRQRLGATAAYALICCGYVLLAPWFESTEREALLGDAFQLTLCVGLLLKAGRHYLFEAEERWVESVAIFITLSAAISDVVAQVLGFHNFYSLTRTLPLFVVAVVASLFYRNVRLYESGKAINDMLNTQLAAKEAALRESYERTRVLEREKLLGEERQRILEDMHDGVGGRLASLLQTQRNRPDAAGSVTRELEQSMQELLIAIDSLDPELNRELGSALGVLRQRIEPLLADTGIQLIWDIRLDPGIAAGPEKTLHLYRCVQEAISNAARHAGASKVCFTATNDTTSITLSISDNGCGMQDSHHTGRGLSIMRRRMSQVGGQVDIDSDRSGTRVRLSLEVAPQRSL